MVKNMKPKKLDIHMYDNNVSHITHKHKRKIWFCYYDYDELFEEVENNEPYFYIHVPDGNWSKNYVGKDLIQFIKRKRLEPHWLRFREDVKKELYFWEKKKNGCNSK